MEISSPSQRYQLSLLSSSIAFWFCARNQGVRPTQQSLFPGLLEGTSLSCRDSLEWSARSEQACVTNSLICAAQAVLASARETTSLEVKSLPPYLPGSQREIGNDALQPVCILHSSWEQGVACGQLYLCIISSYLHRTKPCCRCFGFLGQCSL